MGSVSIKFNCWEYSQRRAKVAKSSESLVRILPAEEIISRGSGEPEPFIWPNRASWFAERSMRLKQLARQSGSIGAYIGLIAELVQAQHNCLNDLPEVTVPSAEQIAQAAEHGLPPLSALDRSVEHTSELPSRGHLVCRLLLENTKPRGHLVRV